VFFPRRVLLLVYIGVGIAIAWTHDYFDHLGTWRQILSAILAAVHLTVTRNAERIVRDELAASGTVFGRIWSMRAEELQNGAALLAQDFGFRAALATRDAATIGSALGNLKTRLKIDSAFVLGPDGEIVASSAPGGRRPSAEVLAAIVDQETATGVFVMDGVPYQGVAAPILNPTLAGWVGLRIGAATPW